MFYILLSKYRRLLRAFNLSDLFALRSNVTLVYKKKPKMKCFIRCKRPSLDWANDSMDEIVLSVPLPKRHHSDELNPEEDELFVKHVKAY